MPQAVNAKWRRYYERNLIKIFKQRKKELWIFHTELKYKSGKMTLNE